MKMTPTAPFLFHLTLLVQTGLAEGSCEIDNCLPDSCDGHNCTLCEDGYYKSAHPFECYPCYLYCRDCGDDQCYGCSHTSCHGCKHSNCYGGCTNYNVYCTSCPDGYYRSIGGRCSRCLHSNCQCSTANNCTRCLSGKYGIANFCRNDCPDECITCRSKYDCIECVPGKFGSSCQQNCTTTCQDGTCNKTNGTCSQECADNQYLDPAGQCRNCQIRCINCTEYHNCTTCDKSYHWGSYCQYDCLSCSGQCDKDNGCLSGCAANYYHNYNTNKQGFDCTVCPQKCISCTSSVDCIDCEIGYWGTHCQHNCTGCSSECKKANGCQTGCNVKYFQQYNTAKQGYECLRCLNTCTTCTNLTYCIDCETGYWGAYCQNMCTGCFNRCRKSDGCGNRCFPGYYPHRIDNGYFCGDCSERCKSCINATCNDCEQGYYVSNINNCTECPINCINSSCDTKNGICTEGCIAGFSGNQCQQNCSNHCIQCEQLNRSSCTACEVGYYGDSCDSGCGFCKQSKCFKNGICEHGYVKCLKDWICVEKADVLSSEQKDDSRDTLIVALSILSGIAVPVAIVLVTGIIILMRKGRLKFIRYDDMTTSKASRDRGLESNAYQDLRRSRSDEGNYSTVSRDYENTL